LALGLKAWLPFDIDIFCRTYKMRVPNMRKVAQQTSSGTRSVVKGFVYSTAVAALLAAAPAQANDVDEMRAELQNLLDRMERVEQRQTQSADMAALPTYTRAIKRRYVPEIPSHQRTSWDLRDRYIMPETARGNGVVGGALPGSFKAPGSDTSIAVGGSAHLGVAWNGGQTHVFPTNQSASLVPADAATANDGVIDMRTLGASVSASSSTPTDMGDLGVTLVISNDTAATAANSNLYVTTSSMHGGANVTLGNWTFGQHGSSFFGVTGGAESAAGLDGLGTFLAPGISYSSGAGGLSYTVSLFPPTSSPNAAGSAIGAGSQALPDLHASISTALGGMTLGVSGYAREYGIVQLGSENAICNATIDQTQCGGEETKAGFGGAIGISMPVGADTLNVGLVRATACRGCGNYQNWARSEGESFTVDPVTGSVTGTTHTVVTANFTHNWGGSARSTIGATTQSLNVQDGTADNTLTRAHQAIANIFWSPVPAVNLGLEVNWITVTRRLNSGSKDSAMVVFKASSAF